MSESSVPLVSIIIPCYNTARFVAETMRSALAQTYKNIELIVVNDGSTDDSEAVIKSVQDSRIHYVFQQNKGLSAARNTGIKNAKGSLLTFLDADDLFSPDKIKIQVDFLQKSPEFDIVSCGFFRTNEQGDILYPVKPKEKKLTLIEMLSGSQFPVHTALVRRSVIEKTGFFDTDLRAAEDWDYWCRCALQNAQIYRLAQPLCTYRLLDNAMTSNAPRQTEMLRRVVEKNFANPLLPQDLKPFKTESLEKVFLTGAARCLVLEFYKEGKDYLRQALELNPKISAQNFTVLCGKIAGMMVHMNVTNANEKAAQIYAQLSTDFTLSNNFTHNILFRFALTRGESPVKLMNKRKNIALGLRMVFDKIKNK